jgi:hypothetical protein
MGGCQCQSLPVHQQQQRTSPMLRLSLSLLLLAVAATTAAALPLPFWSAQVPNAKLPLGGLPRLPSVTTQVLFNGSLSSGFYNHGAMLAYSLASGLTVAWKNGEFREDAPGQRVKVVQSANGQSWTEPALLFPSLSTAAMPTAQFAGPFASIEGRLYASATPAVIATGDAQGSQFCLWPDGLDPRNAGPPGQAQPVGTLMLKRILPGLGNFGPAFWAASSVPAGFGPASAAAGILTVGQTDEQTQADVAALKSSCAAGRGPCESAASGGTLKCEACAGGCQEYMHLPHSFANERSHWVLPGSVTDVLVYRTHDSLLHASVRLDGASQANWSQPLPTNIPNDNSNINAGPLPSGAIYLLQNAVPNTVRDPLTIAFSKDGLNFSTAAALMTCTDLGSSTCSSRAPVSNGEGPSYPQGLTVVDPAPLSLQGFYVVATNNKEDVVLARVPFAALPEL